MERFTQEGLNLSDYWQILKKRKIIAIISFILVISSVYFYTRATTPVYQSNVTIELRYQTPTPSSIMGGYVASMLRMLNRDTELRKVRSYPIISAVAKKMGLIDENTAENERNRVVNSLKGKISVSEVGNTTLIRLSVTDSDPGYAIKLANTAANAYIEITIADSNERARKSREFIENQLNIVGMQLRDGEDSARKFKLTGKITDRISNYGSTLSGLMLQRSRLLIKYGEKHPDIVSLDKQISGLKLRMGNLTGDELEYLYLMREVTINEELYMMLNKRLKEALIAEADKVIPVGVVDPARGAVLIRPNKRMNMLMGLIVGLLLAVLGVIIQENLDTALRTAHDVETYLKTPVLTEIPHIKIEKDVSDLPYLLSEKKPSAYLEAYNTLSASILSFSHNKKIQTILFTSMMPREGKTEVISNFGIIESQRDNKTLIIDADFRQPTLHRAFKVSRKPGIIDVITEGLNWKTAVRPAASSSEIQKILKSEDLQNIKNLSIMSVGHSPPNPLRFLSSPEFKDIVTKARQEFDIILLDSPPLYYFADPTVLSGIVDGIVLVHKPGSIERAEVLRTKEQLSTGDSKFLGVVLNEVKGKRKGKYYYYYYSHSKR